MWRPRGTLADDSAHLVGRHVRRPNIIVRIRPEPGVITVTHGWNLKKSRWGGNKLLDAVNDANRMSWLSTLCINSDGDLLVSSYINIVDGLTEEDVLSFLEREQVLFAMTLMRSDLSKYMK